MDMNGQQRDPELTYQDPQAYIAWLRSQRIPPQQIATMVQNRFGPGKTPQQRQQEAQKAKSQGGLASTAGTVGGLIVGREAAQGFPNVKEYLGYGAEQQPALAQSGTLSINRPVPTPTTTVDGSAATVDIGDAGTMQLQTPAGVQDVPVEALNDPGFMNNINWDQVAQGGLSLMQMYGAYKQYKQGNMVGAGITGAAGAGNLAAATGAVTTGAGAGTMGTYVIPGLNILAGAYGGYQTAEALSDMAAGSKRTQTGVLGGAASGAALGSLAGPWGTAIGAAVGAVAGAAGAYFGSSKKKPQMQRDAIRGVLQKGGILDDKFQGTLADGSTYDFGKDGSTLKWKNIDKIAEAQPTAWNAAVPAADALAASYGFVGQKASDIAAWYAKGAVSNAGDDPTIALQNMQHFAKQQGVTFDMIKSKLDEAKADNRVNDTMYNHYLNGARQLTGAAGSAQPEVARPPKGQLARVSPGMYMDSTGRVGRQSDMRKSLEKNMNKEKKDGKRR